MKKKNVQVQIVRVCAMIMIILCHFANNINNYYIKMTGQFFNVGVYIFLLISGYLYANKQITNYKKWFLDKIKKLLIPIYIFILFLFLYFLFFRSQLLDIKYILIYLINMQGFFGSINGAGHLWFMTALMVCYLTLPLLKKVFNDKYLILVFLVTFVISIITSFINNKASLYFFYILTFLIGYIYKIKYDKIKLNSLVYFILIIVVSIIRIVFKIIFDETTLYSVIVVSLTQIVISICIFRLIFCITKTFKNNKIISYLDNISYYIYITHYMYIVGPLLILKNSKRIYLDLILILLFSIISANILRFIHKIILKSGDNHER